jgi:amino acid adenylation domain-containing protein
MQASAYAAVQDMFAEAADRFRDSVAVDNGRRRVTYGELEAKAGRLGGALSALGIARGSIVGLFTDDTIEIIAAMLGVLKAGGVFCPLDPTFPDGRLRVMAEGVSPAWYVTESRHLAKLRGAAEGVAPAAKFLVVDDAPPAGDDADVLYLSDERFGGASVPAAEPDPDAPCSIYFTSGSTGRPKAILGRLKGIDHYVRWEIKALGVGPGTRVTQLTSPSFDGFLKDAFVPLCAGGTVCAPESRDVVLDAARLVDWLDVEQIELLHCVPSVFRSIINQGLNADYFGALKWAVLVGEPLYPSDVKRWMDVFGTRVRLWNIYGTTETSIVKLSYEIKAEDVERPTIPIGKPIRGAAVMLLDQHGQPCGVGDVGEIYIRTPYRSHGYYNQPELTREVFVQNPFNDDPADLLQRTGDFGRLLGDGNLELLGRRDQQVKVRGVRVELGEIENLLRGHEAVADVAVVDRDDAEGNKFLVAYVTMSNGTRAEELRPYLTERLPETMLPSAFVQLEKMPRTLNGKVDRKALPALEQLHAERAGNDSGSLTPVEEIMAGIWCEVLKLPAVGRSDNFFNLGGHSLLVTHTILRVRDILKVELPVRSLFEAPTLEQFSRVVQQRINDGASGETTEIVPVPRDGELPLSFSQQRMWLFEQLSGESASFQIPLGVRLKGRLNIAALEQTLGEIVRRHESLRTVFPPADNLPRQVIRPPRNFALPVVDLTYLPEPGREAEAARLAQEDALRPFDLAGGPLLRIALLRLSETEHVVVCTMHHIIGDGQSFEVIISEMSRLYGVFSDGQPSPLPELQVQYADFAAWQRQWLQGEVLETRLAYWRRQLEDAPRKLSLPQRRTRPKVQTFKGARQEINFPRELSGALKELSHREGVTLLMTMLAAYVLLLNQYTGDEDIIVGTPYANRERPETAGLIGILTHALVLRVDLSGAATFRDVLGRVREVCLDAYSYQVPPELLREDFNGRGAEVEQLFEVWFQLEREERERLEMSGLDYDWYLAHKEETKFELSMLFTEHKNEIEGFIEYDVELFDEEMMTEMRQSYVWLLEQAVTNPDRRL